MTSTADEQAEAGAQAYAALLDGGPPAVRLRLHPYLHWTLADGTRVRGRLKVLALLDRGLPPAAPRVTELRDGQIYRWDSTD